MERGYNFCMETQKTRTTPLQWAILFGTAALLLILDQVSKALIVANFTLYESKIPIEPLKNVFDLTYTRNTGAAFGLFDFAGNVFMVVALVASVVIIYYYRQVEGRAFLLRFAMGLQLGGALGNAIDRVTRGFVVDFLHVFYEPLGLDYPVFNFADSGVVIGVGLLILALWLEDRKKAKEKILSPEPAIENEV
jgi:signal peptidase II